MHSPFGQLKHRPFEARLWLSFPVVMCKDIEETQRLEQSRRRFLSEVSGHRRALFEGSNLADGFGSFASNLLQTAPKNPDRCLKFCFCFWGRLLDVDSDGFRWVSEVSGLGLALPSALQQRDALLGATRPAGGPVPRRSRPAAGEFFGVTSGRGVASCLKQKDVGVGQNPVPSVNIPIPTEID